MNAIMLLKSEPPFPQAHQVPSEPIERRKSFAQFETAIADISNDVTKKLAEHASESRKTISSVKQVLGEIRDHQIKTTSRHDTQFTNMERRLENIDGNIANTSKICAGHDTSIKTLHKQADAQEEETKDARERMATLEESHAANHLKKKQNGSVEVNFWTTPNGKLALAIILTVVIGFFGVMGVQLSLHEIIEP